MEIFHPYLVSPTLIASHVVRDLWLHSQIAVARRFIVQLIEQQCGGALEGAVQLQAKVPSWLLLQLEN